MRFSVKLLLLCCSLIAIFMAAWKAKQLLIASSLQSSSNTDWHTEFLEEPSGRISSYAVDAAGDVQSATLRGPNALALIKQNGRRSELEWLAFEDLNAFELFDPVDFPGLQSVAIQK